MKCNVTSWCDDPSLVLHCLALYWRLVKEVVPFFVIFAYTSLYTYPTLHTPLIKLLQIHLLFILIKWKKKEASLISFKSCVIPLSSSLRPGCDKMGAHLGFEPMTSHTAWADNDFYVCRSVFSVLLPLGLTCLLLKLNNFYFSISRIYDHCFHVKLHTDLFLHSSCNKSKLYFKH